MIHQYYKQLKHSYLTSWGRGVWREVTCGYCMVCIENNYGGLDINVKHKGNNKEKMK